MIHGQHGGVCLDIHISRAEGVFWHRTQNGSVLEMVGIRGI